jgi:predicted dienelactone hydrolase
MILAPSYGNIAYALLLGLQYHISEVRPQCSTDIQELIGFNGQFQWQLLT